MLDELARTRAVELRPSQIIRLKTGVAVEKGLTPQVIKAFGDRVSELMETLLQNMRDPDNSAFVASIADVKVPVTEIPLLRREISSRGSEFLSEIQDMLTNGPINGGKSRVKNTSSVTVTISYHEELGKSKPKECKVPPRRNLRRN
jgi:hypothetical protein